MSNESLLLFDDQRGVRLQVLIQGVGETVVLVPSALRGAGDFHTLQETLTSAGYRSVALNPRGVGQSSPPSDETSLRDLADDVAFVIRTVTEGCAHVVGHALGNVVVRSTASWHPNLVATVTVMPCGGHNLATQPVSREVLDAFTSCHDLSLSPDERLRALQIAFFAPGNDPTSWLDGWYPTAALRSSSLFGDPEHWWRAGTAPVLIMQPMEDAMAPISVGMDAAEALGDRAEYVEIPRCGHAILPEQPQFVAQHLVRFLARNPVVGEVHP